MIIPMLISSALFVTPVKDTVWWDTPGGKVTAHSDPTAANCSLMLYDDNGSVTFTWDNSGKIIVTAIDPNWQFPDNWTVPVAMQLGDAWVNNGANSAVIEGVGHGSAVSFATDQPIGDLLSPADHIEVRTAKAELSVNLSHPKLGILLSQTGKCRDTIKR